MVNDIQIELYSSLWAWHGTVKCEPTRWSSGQIPRNDIPVVSPVGSSVTRYALATRSSTASTFHIPDL